MFIISEIILVGLITWALIAYVSGFGSSNFFERTWVSQDLKMLVETIVSSPQLALYDYMMPTTDTINSSNTKIKITEKTIEITSKENEKEQKTTQLYAYSFFRKFIDKDEDVKFRFESNGNLTSVLSISEIDDKKLTCDRFIQTNTKKTEKKIIGFNSNAANKRIVVLLTEYFTQGLRKGSYEIKDSGDLDLYVYMECTASPKIVISEPRPGSQKFRSQHSGPHLHLAEKRC